LRNSTISSTTLALRPATFADSGFLAADVALLLRVTADSFEECFPFNALFAIRSPILVLSAPAVDHC